MPEYTPFLKFKKNEISALAEFEGYRKKGVVPFFDVPRPKDISESEILDRIRIGVDHIERHLPEVNFYIDNFDLDDSIKLNGKTQYAYILQAVSHLNAIPVVALNRDGSHNPAALATVQKTGCDVAIRLTLEDIESYKLTKPDLAAIWPLLVDAKPREIHVVIDFRVVASDLDKLKDVAVNFVNSLCADFYIDRIVFTGSSIPPVITAILSTNSNTSIERQEWHLWKKIEASLSKSILSKSHFGDYGLVSPEYSDLDLEIWMVQGVAAPKVFYTYDTRYFVVRGGAFKTHPNGYGQYFDIADVIVAKPFYRKPAYSFGDKYIYDRSALTTKRAKRGGSPSSWLKATLSSHITFIVDVV